MQVAVVNLWSEDVGNPRASTNVPNSQETPRPAALDRSRSRTAFAGCGIAAAFSCSYPRKRQDPATIAPEKSIAVLPFENLGEEQTNAYFAEGIQEEILTRLAKIADLKVISRTSTQQYQSKPGNLSEIAKQLGVGTILEGSVQKVADQVRVNVQLINAQSDSHLWAESYDRKLTDVFSVESEIAKRIAESLQAKLLRQVMLGRHTDARRQSYDPFLKGEYEEREAERHTREKHTTAPRASIGNRWRGIRISRLLMRGWLTTAYIATGKSVA